MNVSRLKTEYLCINGGNDKKTVKMEDTKVPRVKEFKYLASTVQESGSCEREVKKECRQDGMDGEEYCTTHTCMLTMVSSFKLSVLVKKLLD